MTLIPVFWACVPLAMPLMLPLVMPLSVVLSAAVSAMLEASQYFEAVHESTEGIIIQSTR